MAAGVAAAGLLSARDPGTGPWLLFVVIASGWAGGVAPDRMEWVPGCRVRWVPHRTLTHWGLAWGALLAFAVWRFPAAPLEGALLGGFALGGCAHLLGDWPNPTGVPWLCPTCRGRHSLDLWTSGTNDGVLSLLAWALAIIPWVPRAAAAARHLRAHPPHAVALLIHICLPVLAHLGRALSRFAGG